MPYVVEEVAGHQHHVEQLPQFGVGEEVPPGVDDGVHTGLELVERRLELLLQQQRLDPQLVPAIRDTKRSILVQWEK